MNWMCGWYRVHRLCAIRLRRRQAGEIAKTPRPCQPVLRSAGRNAPSGDYLKDRCGDRPWVCIQVPRRRFPHFPPPGRDVLWDNRRCSGGLRTLFASPRVQWVCAPGRERPCAPLNEGSPMKTIRLVSTPTRNRRLNEIIGMVVLVGAALLITRRATRETQLPMGPFLVFGALVALGLVAWAPLMWHGAGHGRRRAGI